MTAFYNEIDPFAAAWLRELIKAGHIAPGVVDERSIEDIKPKDLDGFSQCHFFAGIGVWSYALRNAGWPDDRPVWTGSCPCQPFSAAGQGAGFDDERHLWPAFHHLIKECTPAAVFGEQVASKDAGPWIDLVQTDMEALGYAFGAVPFPSAGVGAPHIRDRLFWVANSDSRQRNGVAIKRGDVRDGQNSGWAKKRGELESRSNDGWLAHNDSNGRSAQPIAGVHNAQHYVEPCGGAGGLGHTLMPGRQPVSDEPGSDATGVGSPRRESVELSQTSGNAGGLDDARQDHDAAQVSAASVGQSQADRPANLAGGSGVSPCAGPGPTNGFWADADWLLCRDGKFRPVEPGTFPLAHGSPARVGRLRGYGNAINAHQAQIFIEALMP